KRNRRQQRKQRTKASSLFPLFPPVLLLADCPWRGFMKGPGHRHRFDVRRNWVCPACNRRVKTSGRVVHLLCDCLMKSTPPRQTWMTLLEEKPRAQPSAAPGIPQQEE